MREFDRAFGKFNFLLDSKELFLIVLEGLQADLPAEDVIIHGEDVEIQTEVESLGVGRWGDVTIFNGESERVGAVWDFGPSWDWSHEISGCPIQGSVRLSWSWDAESFVQIVHGHYWCKPAWEVSVFLTFSDRPRVDEAVDSAFGCWLLVFIPYFELLLMLLHSFEV